MIVWESDKNHFICRILSALTHLEKKKKKQPTEKASAIQYLIAGQYANRNIFTQKDDVKDRTMEFETGLSKVDIEEDAKTKLCFVLTKMLIFQEDRLKPN